MSVLCAVMIFGGSASAAKTQFVTPLTEPLNPRFVSSAFVHAYTIDFKLKTNINIVEDLKNVWQRIIEFNDTCMSNALSTSTINLCAQHLNAISLEAEETIKQISSIPSARPKRWVAPVVLGATFLSTAGFLAGYVTKNTE